MLLWTPICLLRRQNDEVFLSEIDEIDYISRKKLLYATVTIIINDEVTSQKAEVCTVHAFLIICCFIFLE